MSAVAVTSKTMTPLPPPPVITPLPPAAMAPLSPAVVAPPSPAASVRLKPVYYRRAEGSDCPPGVGDTPPKTTEDRFRVSSGVLMVRKDSHHHVESNVEMIRSLARQRNGLLICAVVFLVVLTILVSTWGILKHFSFN
ncbi:uncharacterized protein LOC122377813 [Amphibalanus amphitrite]|uniref:uncharacterized protein LOC122377813 n=1 Tax=Amphibalanus amphitrite TaxID=1232801 RepID=UPI001C922877|nr:uncharacterized protein LOC122377813 [Amphibalanus amphitrite]XP_043214192.1 uncharacterized protein LOC122377813 [Amphibalanus amphitrite]